MSLNNLDSLKELEIDMEEIEGKLLQLAVENTNGTYGEIKEFLKSLIEVHVDSGVSFSQYRLLAGYVQNALDTLEWTISDIKPFDFK